MWEQGQHLAVVGETGMGKTTLLRALCKPHRFRDHIIVLQTKRKDDTFDGWAGYRRIKSLKDITHSQHFYILQPPRPANDNATLRAETIRLLDMADRQGGWTVVLDELFFVQEKLKLESYLDDLFTQGRSGHLTICWGAQRPVRITRFALSQSTHVFAFAMEGRDAQELGYATSQLERQAVNRLDAERYQFAYFNRRQRASVRVGTARSVGQVLGG